MTIADFCILIAALLPYATSAYAKALAPSSFDNADPRKPGGYTGSAARANSAHLNGFEIFPFFAISVLFAELYTVSQSYVDLLSGLFIVLRILYVYVYVQGWPSIRSMVFTAGLLIPFLLFISPLFIG